MERPDFNSILPLLVTSYQQGRLVPFLGAGMSAPTLNLWGDFLKKLEHKARVVDVGANLTLDARAQRACTIIQNQSGRRALLSAVRDALCTCADRDGQSPGQVPDSTL